MAASSAHVVGLKEGGRTYVGAARAISPSMCLPATSPLPSCMRKEDVHTSTGGDFFEDHIPSA